MTKTRTKKRLGRAETDVAGDARLLRELATLLRSGSTKSAALRTTLRAAVKEARRPSVSHEKFFALLKCGVSDEVLGDVLERTRAVSASADSARGALE